MGLWAICRLTDAGGLRGQSILSDASWKGCPLYFLEGAYGEGGRPSANGLPISACL